MKRALPQFARAASALLIVGGVTLIALRFDANATTAGFAFLITILGIAVYADLFTAIVGSLAAAAVYNFFFFAPVHTFSIAAPSNWVALAAFLAASLLSSRLVLRARTQAANAEARRAELEALYALSVDLFSATGLREAVSRALANVGAPRGELVMIDGEESDELIALVSRVGKTVELPAAKGRDVYVPVKSDANVIAVLVARDTNAAPRALESAAALVGLAIERERFLAESAHMGALKEREALKTSLLRAVSHDLVTPLTAMALQIERLRRIVDDPAVDAIADDASRLRRRIENLLAMARLESGSVIPRPEPTPAADLFRAAREHLPMIVESRPVEVRVAGDCPEVFVDPSLALEVLVNLIENADKASPAGSPLELSASRHPTDPGCVRLEVADRGHGIAAADPSDTPRQGLGLEIARSLSAACGGTVTLANRNGGGTVASIDLPAADLPALDEESRAG
jgi:two-component system, OmpR family, sensor histidine kinase KdpD